jgi:hypothetical protein
MQIDRVLVQRRDVASRTGDDEQIFDEPRQAGALALEYLARMRPARRIAVVFHCGDRSADRRQRLPHFMSHTHQDFAGRGIECASKVRDRCLLAWPDLVYRVRNIHKRLRRFKHVGVAHGHLHLMMPRGTIVRVWRT